jgi:hypothetical protein
VAVNAAAERLPLEREAAALNAQSLAVEQNIGHFAPGRPKDSMESRAGDVHPLSALLMPQPLQIPQSDRLRLFHR